MLKVAGRPWSLGSRVSGRGKDRWVLGSCGFRAMGFLSKGAYRHVSVGGMGYKVGQASYVKRDSMLDEKALQG